METTGKIKQNLPGSSSVLILGILALVFSFGTVIVGLVLGIVTVSMASKQRGLYLGNPGEYTESSLKDVNAGQVCGIISICISAIFLVFIALIFCGIIALSVGALTFGL